MLIEDIYNTSKTTFSLEKGEYTLTLKGKGFKKSEDRVELGEKREYQHQGCREIRLLILQNQMRAMMNSRR